MSRTVATWERGTLRAGLNWRSWSFGFGWSDLEIVVRCGPVIWEFEWHRCGMCGGWGFVEVYGATPRDDDAPVSSHRCGACNGSGRGTRADHLQPPGMNA